MNMKLLTITMSLAVAVTGTNVGSVEPNEVYSKKVAEILAKLPVSTFGETTTKIPGDLVSLISEFAKTEVDWKTLEHPASLDTRRGMSTRSLKRRIVTHDVNAIKALIAQLPQDLQKDQLDRLSKARTSAQRGRVRTRVKKLLLRTPEELRVSAAKSECARKWSECARMWPKRRSECGGTSADPQTHQ